jgi:hypothetical protein
MEPVKRPADRQELAALSLEHLPDREVGQFGVLGSVGVGNASVERKRSLTPTLCGRPAIG